MTLTNSGTLGLGVTTPINTLHVVGTSTVTSVAHFGNDVNVAGDITTLQGLTAATLTVSSVSATLNGNVYAASGVSTFSNLKVTGTGVGIGTTNPAAGGIAINSGTSSVFINGDGDIGIKTTATFFSGIEALQNNVIIGGVGIGTTNPSSVADFGDAGKVGIVTTNRFIIPPKLTNTQRGQIAAPQAGALIYNTNANRLQFYTGTEWLGIATAAL